MERLLPRLSAEQRTAFLAAVRSLVGTRYRHQGRTARGVDCVGLPVYALQQIGVACEDLFGYSPRPDGLTLQANVEKHLGPPTDKWKPGDIVLMRWYERGDTVYCNHVGVLGMHANRWTLIHAYAQLKRVTEHSLAGHWPRRVYAVYSLGGDA
jgi:cell wall-associated NlpC family hydrolase